MSTGETVMNPFHPLLPLFLSTVATSAMPLKSFLPTTGLLPQLDFLIFHEPLQRLSDYSAISDLLPPKNGKAFWKS